MTCFVFAYLRLLPKLHYQNLRYDEKVYRYLLATNAEPSVTKVYESLSQMLDAGPGGVSAAVREVEETTLGVNRNNKTEGISISSDANSDSVGQTFIVVSNAKY